ncbi:hypothetical protein A9995_06045 [Erythrobacter sp. QSSC1-22B]|nr:hypothetical protein A9995_06045 [Erythrobacter sp. QSSC1-22B]
MQADQTTTFLIIIAAIVIVLAAIWFFLRQRKTTKLRDRYGEEYDRTVDRVGGRGKAERNLAEREQRVSDFHIRPLTLAERDRFTAEWHETKTLFVDSPQEAVLRGDRLLGAMMEARGFPVENFDRRYEDLTVDHAEVANHYRQGHEIADKGGDATTEEMRRALNHYEKLFADMVRDAGEGVGDQSGEVDNARHEAHTEIGDAGADTGTDTAVDTGVDTPVDTTVTYDSAERPIRPG